MSLFQKSVEKKYINELDSALIDAKYSAFSAYFGNKLIQQNIKSAKEEQFQEGFLRELFVNILGYTLQPEPDYNLISEYKNITNSRKADGAILRAGEALAVIELKSLATTDLDTIESQAFGYKNHHPKCIYVITSNFGKLRFYIRNAVEYIDFDLFNLSRNQFCLLWLCLAKDNLLNDVPLKIKDSSLLQEENITKKLYADYSKFRNAIYNNLVENNPELDKLLLFKKTQKLLDRFLFVFFAEDRLLLPPNAIREIINQWETLRDVLDEYIPLYDRFKKYFGYLNTGFKNKNMEIFAYNGGLFADDEILDNITIDDEILYHHTLKLSQYDFDTEVDVNILGHIFEHSLGEIENIQADLNKGCLNKGLQMSDLNKGLQMSDLNKGLQMSDLNKGLQPLVHDSDAIPLVQEVRTSSKKSKRKKDGIYYTPRYITKYIVENTVGKLCAEKRAEFGINPEEYAIERTNKDKDIIIALDEKLSNYRNWFLTITILDPACGSGAFLNQALEFLIEEHRKLDELRALLFGGGLVFADITNDILENNIFGVDINEESVEIAKLSLWLRTAQKGRKLNTLTSNIKCGNSLIDDPAVAGDKAFNWEKEFPQVFKEKELKAWHITWVTYNSRVSERMITYKNVIRKRRMNKSVPLNKGLQHDVPLNKGLQHDLPLNKGLQHDLPLNKGLQPLVHDSDATPLVHDSDATPLVHDSDATPNRHEVKELKITDPNKSCLNKDRLNKGCLNKGLQPLVQKADTTPLVQKADATHLVSGSIVQGHSWQFDEEMEIEVTKHIKDIVLENKYIVPAFNICDDHIHLLLICEEKEISNIVRKLKGKSSQKIKEYLNIDNDSEFHLWAQKYNTSFIENDEKLYNTIQYINNNRIKHDLPLNKGLQPLVQEMITPIEEAFKPQFTGGFDVVIGNPPYGAGLTDIEKEYFKLKYEDVHFRTIDTFNYFISQSFRILKHNGLISLIVPNNLLFQFEYFKTRLFLVQSNKLEIVLNFGDGVFQDADVPTCLFVAKKCQDNNYFINFKDIRNEIIKHNNINENFQLINSNNVINMPANIIGVSDISFNLIEKVKSKSVKIDDIVDEVASGISTGGDKIFRVHSEFAKSNNFEKDLLRNVLVGGEINRYTLENTNHNLIYTYRNCQIDEFTNIRNYLLNFKDKLLTRSESKAGILPWYSLNRQRYERLFMEDKIILRQTSDDIKATVDFEGYFTLDSINVLKIKDSKIYDYLFVVTILNSKLNNYIYKKFSQEEGRTFAQVKPNNVRKLFIPTISLEAQLPFIELANIMLEKNKELQDIKNKFLDLLIADFSIEKLRTKLQNWYELSWADFTAELRKLKIELKGIHKEDWSERHTRMTSQAQEIKTIITQTDRTIDRLV
ncbi:MAG: N-6 DNA methylase, partial [Candidatus Kapaibacterium sp.]